MQLDHSRDHLVWANTEKIVLVSTRSLGDMVDDVPRVRRHLVGVKEQAASMGAYTAGDVLFYVPSPVLPAALGTPKPGDIVIDGDQVRYTVLSVDARRRDRNSVQTYKLQARDLSVQYQLEDRITIETPQRELDAAGARVITGWKAKYPLLPAKVQPTGDAQAEERGMRGGKTTYTVIVDRQVKVAIGEDRIKWVKGLVESGGTTAEPLDTDTIYLDIIAYKSPELVTELPVIEATVGP